MDREDLKAVEGLAAFPGMVELHEGETVVLAWIVCPSRAERDAIDAKVMADPRLQGLCGEGAEMPFDSRRMVYGGFEALVGG